MTRRRLKLTTVAPLLVGLVILLAFSVVALVGIRASDTMAQQLLVGNSRATLSLSARLLFNPLYNLDVWTLQRTLDAFLGETNVVHAAVRDTRGQIVAEVAEGWVPPQQVSRDLSIRALAQRDIVQREVGGYLVLCGPIAVGSEQIGTLEIVFDQSPLQASTAYMQRTMPPVYIVLLIGTVLVVAMLARYAMMSLGALVATADEIGHGNLDTPVPVRGTEETAVLGVALERMRTDLQELYLGLEQQVAVLERRAKQLQVAAEVAHEATVELDVPALLQRVVTLISERFGFYHTGVFLLDESGQWAVLQAASSEGGRRMLERGHQVRVGQMGIVGYVTARGEPRIASDVGAGAVHFDHPDLPNTRSELVLPLRARGAILGALDVQSTETDAFTDEDVEMLRILADQVAMAISNARLFQQAQESLGAMRRAYGELSGQAWSEMVRTRPVLGYYCDDSGVTPVTERADARDDKVLSPLKGEHLPALAIPLTVRGRVIGTVRAHKSDGAGEWTVEEVTLMEALTDQLGVALESARLYQDTQRRAVRERLTSEVTARMRGTLDVDTVLQTAVREIGEALGLHDMTIQLEMDADRTD